MDDKEFLNAVKDTHKARNYFLDQIAYTIGPERLLKLKEKSDSIYVFSAKNTLRILIFLILEIMTTILKGIYPMLHMFLLNNLKNSL